MKKRNLLLALSMSLLLSGCIVEVTDDVENTEIDMDIVTEISALSQDDDVLITSTPSITPIVTCTEVSNPDLELITRPNHPVLFSSVDSAHEFWGDEKGFLGWKDRQDRKISYPDTTSNSFGSGVDWTPCILQMDSDMTFGSSHSNYIFGIHISLGRFEKPANLSLDEALDIAASYLPYETLKSYYKYNYSLSYEAINSSEYNDFYYEVSYSPIDENAHDLVLNDYSYSFPRINITLRKDKEENITDIWIDLHQSMCEYGRNSIAYGGNYAEVEWDYDFLK